MKLYHGTYIDFNSIDLGKSLPYKDFGKGFYLTDIKPQAEKLARKKSRIFGGNPIVMEYDFDEKWLTSPFLKVKVFAKPDKEWAEFIYKNRSRRLGYQHGFDIVIGPIANDGVAYLLSRYEEGIMTLEDLAESLKYKKLNRQYYFGTGKSIKLLKRYDFAAS